VGRRGVRPPSTSPEGFLGKMGCGLFRMIMFDLAPRRGSWVVALVTDRETWERDKFGLDGI
jgi:hypothetical protein